MLLRSEMRKFALSALAVLSLGGCEQYLERRDPVTLAAGNAVAVNKATQTINRWPRAAQDDRWLSDGEKARLAVHRYKTDTVKDPKAINKPAAAEPEAKSNEEASGSSGTGK